MSSAPTRGAIVELDCKYLISNKDEHEIETTLSLNSFRCLFSIYLDPVFYLMVVCFKTFHLLYCIIVFCVCSYFENLNYLQRLCLFLVGGYFCFEDLNYLQRSLGTCWRRNVSVGGKHINLSHLLLKSYKENNQHHRHNQHHQQEHQ